MSNNKPGANVRTQNLFLRQTTSASNHRHIQYPKGTTNFMTWFWVLWPGLIFSVRIRMRMMTMVLPHAREICYRSRNGNGDMIIIFQHSNKRLPSHRRQDYVMTADANNVSQTYLAVGRLRIVDFFSLVSRRTPWGCLQGNKWGWRLWSFFLQSN